MRNIILFCSAGMSTGVLVKKMQAVADKMGYSCKIAAYSISEVSKYGPEADIVLLGPQIRFNLSKVKKQLPEKIVEVIDMRQYGNLNGEGVINFVKDKLGDK